MSAPRWRGWEVLVMTASVAVCITDAAASGRKIFVSIGSDDW